MSDLIPYLELQKRFCKNNKFHKGPIIVDRSLTFVECRNCEQKLNPMDVLHWLASAESGFLKIIKEQRNKVIKLKELVKCEHCGRLTRTKCENTPSKI